mmetsp:Transcript_39524/g.60349  ORF Transcript_39524/g.60349 Transcript_39524/m.60349 type:complete len:95 (-) Transcript_39524:513-797(-)
MNNTDPHGNNTANNTTNEVQTEQEGLNATLTEDQGADNYSPVLPEEDDGFLGDWPFEQVVLVGVSALIILFVCCRKCRSTPKVFRDGEFVEQKD